MHSYGINGIPKFPEPSNAPFVDFKKGSEERVNLEMVLRRLRSQINIPILPLWIGGEAVDHGTRGVCTPPHDMQRVMATYIMADEPQVYQAIDFLLHARKQWTQIPWFMRLNIFRKAAYLLEHKYFYDAVAVVMEDFSKNPFEAMIDVVELIDFWNFNPYFASEIYQEQSRSAPNELNFLDYRPWEGFVAAIPPNNFVAIALNIPSAPLMMGNVVVCKPAPETIFSFHFMLNILHEAGLPKDALAVLNGDEEMIGKLILTHPDLARVHFTGSMETMHKIIELIGKYIRGYRCFPEVIGETGGKDFMIVYDDQDPFVAATAITRSAFGYQGRKCSALSRLYMTNGMWNKIRPILCENMKHIAVGDVADFQNYLGAIISEQEYKKISGYITRALYDVSTVEVMGGDCKKDEKGYWIRPTVIVTNNPRAETMTEEIFGPVVTVYCMPDKDYAEAVTELCNTTSPYRLTGAISTQNVATLCMALDALRDNAGNIYDFGTTGAVVGRQPFGGAGKSGSNSKPGSKLNLYRWVSPQAVSLTHLKPTDFMPPHLVRG